MYLENPGSAAFARDSFALDWAQSVCHDLDQRIARLAMGLDLTPDERADMTRLLEHPRPVSTTSAHEARAWQELRGLVLLRDSVIKRCVDQFGPVTAGELLLDVERRMEQHGFAPGADGFDVQALLGERAKG
jgi:hypothetical protein